MQHLVPILRSTAGIKVLSAVSGVLVGGWVLLHLAGNLSLLGAPGAADAYAVRLRSWAPLLWTARAGLVAALAIHVCAVTVLQARARRGRPVVKDRRGRRAATWASRTMRIGGPFLALFVVLHVLHMTFGVGVPGFVPLHVHDNVVRGLSAPLVTAVYVLAAAVLGLHVFHGYWSAPRSLGLGIGSAARLRRPVVSAMAIALTAGFAAVPVLVSLGVIR